MDVLSESRDRVGGTLAWIPGPKVGCGFPKAVQAHAFVMPVPNHPSIRPCTVRAFIIIMDLQPFVGPWPLFQFLDPIHSRWDSLDRESAHRKSSTYTEQHKQNKLTQ
jgi:hypothetical protein